MRFLTLLSHIRALFLNQFQRPVNIQLGKQDSCFIHNGVIWNWIVASSPDLAFAFELSAMIAAMASSSAIATPAWLFPFPLRWPTALIVSAF